MEMVEANWHWVKDGDLPDSNRAVWCTVVMNLGGENYYCENLNFNKDLYNVSNWDFEKYKGKKHCGFYDYDSEYGFIEYDDVVCWCELPMMPKELREEM